MAAMYDLHVLGPLRLSQAFFPLLSKTATSRVKGKIVNIGSVISHGLPWHVAYATTKVSRIKRVSLMTLGWSADSQRCHAKRIQAFQH